MTMIKHLSVLFIVLFGCVDVAMAQLLELSVDRKQYRMGEPIAGAARITNTEAEAVEWILEVSLYSEDPRVAVPRKFSEEIEVSGSEEASLEFSLPTEWLIYSGPYEVRGALFDRSYNLISKATQEVTLEGGVLPLDLEVLLCKDQACKQRAKVFARGETLYVDFNVSASGVSISAVIVDPGKKKTPLSLPAAIPLQTAGDYELTVIATKEGYAEATKKIWVGVTERPPESS
jgi:hypothetical protein